MSRGSIIHSLPGGVRIRESTRSRELLTDPVDDGLEQLVRVAGRRFGSGRVKLIGPRHVPRRFAVLAADQDLEL